MNQSRFLQVCGETMAEARDRKGIGTLGEKTLHAVLKQYFEPCVEKQEVPIGSYVADISGEKGIIEIQTRGFDRLRDKLAVFLELGPVTVVYPVPAKKWLVWIDENGEMTPRRKSPKQASPCEVFYELYKIKSLLLHENFRLCVVMLELEEYRLKNGWGNDGKRGSTRFDRMPVALLGELWVASPADYGQFILPGLPAEFTAKEFAKAASLSPRVVSTAMNVLHTVGAVLRVGKKGNAYLYRRAGEA